MQSSVQHSFIQSGRWMGNDNSSTINFGPFQDADFECIFIGTMQPLPLYHFFLSGLGHIQMHNNRQYWASESQLYQNEFGHAQQTWSNGCGANRKSLPTNCS